MNLTPEEAAWRFLVTDTDEPDQFSLAVGATVHLLRDQGCRHAFAEQPVSMADIDEDDIAKSFVLTDTTLSILAGLSPARSVTPPRGATPRPGHALVANSAVILSVCPLPTMAGAAPTSLVLCHVRKGGQDEWVVWRYDESAKSCAHGHYFHNEEAAFMYYLCRRAELCPA